MKDVALLILRLASGLLMAGHGGQKLFGWFNGPGFKGTAGWMESMGLKPGERWGFLAGLSEFGGGVLTVLGFLNPFGSLGTTGAMTMAATKVHWGKPIWVTAGGAELPVLNIATALALGLAGPGKLSVDNALGIKLPRRLILIPGLALVGVAVGAGLAMSKQPQESQAAQPEEQASEAVPVPERPVAGEVQQREEQAMQEPERVLGAELQAGQDVEHPI